VLVAGADADVASRAVPVSLVQAARTNASRAALGAAIQDERTRVSIRCWEETSMFRAK
jgi:hypothetical protein